MAGAGKQAVVGEAGQVLVARGAVDRRLGVSAAHPNLPGSYRPIADMGIIRHPCRMRSTFTSLLLGFLFACAAPDRVQTVERIQLRLSGWEAMDVEVNRLGEGRWHSSEPIPNGRTG